MQRKMLWVGRVNRVGTERQREISWYKPDVPKIEAG